MKSWIYTFIIIIIIVTVIGLNVGIHYWIGNSNLPLWIKLMLLK